jgi:biopolymer transport protein ExbD
MDTDFANKQKENSPYINITPLIDVLLVLLIIFMVVSPMKPSRFEAKIPTENTNDANANIDTLVVTIDKNLELKLNHQGNLGTANDTNKLTARLTEIFDKRRENGVYKQDFATLNQIARGDKIEKTVFIKAPRSIGYGNVAKVIDGIKGAGAEPIGLQIDDLIN